MVTRSLAILLLLQAVSTPPPTEWGKFPYPANLPKFDCSIVKPPNAGQKFSSADPVPLQPFLDEAKSHGFKGGTAVVALTFDNAGTAIGATINKSTGDRYLDKAAINWARCTKIQPGSASHAFIPVDFK